MFRPNINIFFDLRGQGPVACLRVLPGLNRNAVNKLDDEGEFGLRVVKSVG
jgi:hypothetical protein